MNSPEETQGYNFVLRCEMRWLWRDRGPNKGAKWLSAYEYFLVYLAQDAFTEIFHYLSAVK